jgi:hypothetical protein
MEYHPEPKEDQANEAQIEKPNKKEMQAVKYVSGGTLVKKNLFSSWLNIYENEANYFGFQSGIRALPPQTDPEGSSPGLNLFNVKFDKQVEELVFSKFVFYQSITSKPEPDHIFSMVHLHRGIFLSSGSDKKITIWIPGASQENNCLGSIDEDFIVSNMQVFKAKKDEEC